MLDSVEQDIEEGVFEEIESECAALVPVASTNYRAPQPAVSRANANFVTQLIATAEHLPQTRELRRAAPEDVLLAYRAFESRLRDNDPPGATRQTI